MANVRISELPSGTPTLSGVIPYTNAAADTTYQSTFLNVVSLASLDNLSDVNISGVSDSDYVVYNSDESVWKNIQLKAPLATTVSGGSNVWSAGGNLNTGRDALAGAGTQDAGLAVGGFSGSSLNSTEEYDGSNWAAGGNLITARRSNSGAGTQDAGLTFGGENGGNLSSTEEYNGTSWSNGGSLIQARTNFGGCGTQDAALAFGGVPLTSTEEYDGTSWSSGGNLIVWRAACGTAGTQDAALLFGNIDVSTGSATYEYDGTSWSSGGNLNTARRYTAGAGTQNAALAFGGTDGSYSATASTEAYNGSSWTSAENMNTARDSLAGAGTQNAALSFGGFSALDVTEEYSPVLIVSSSGTQQQIRFNQDSLRFEYYNGSGWVYSTLDSTNATISSPVDNDVLIYDSGTWQNAQINNFVLQGTSGLDIGYQSKASSYGQLAHAAGNFAQDGDAQFSLFVARNNTTDDTANVELFLNGSSERMVIPAESTWTFTINLSAYNDTDNTSAWWIIRGGIRRNAANGTALIGSLITERDYEGAMSGTSAAVTADDTNESLKIAVTGLASKNIRWVAVVDVSQVSWGNP